jgi:hypothetical protein
MQKIVLLVFIFLSLFVQINAQSQKLPAKKSLKKELKGGGDGIDNRMKGPDGQAVYIGDKGGRYYFSKTGTKVYLPSAKQKTIKKIKKAMGVK